MIPQLRYLPLILLMVLCCDPMAIVLVIAAGARRQGETYRQPQPPARGAL
jgi:hypothetical protein